jgi:hypothetical protein
MNKPTDTTSKGRVDKAHFANMPEKEAQLWSRGIVDRMMNAYDFKEKKALAKHFGCHQNMPSNWIQTSSVPWTAVHLCHQETNTSLDWLYYGKEPTYDFNENTGKRCKEIIAQQMIFARRLLKANMLEHEAFKMVENSLFDDLKSYFESGTDALDPEATIEVKRTTETPDDQSATDEDTDATN